MSARPIPLVLSTIAQLAPWQRAYGHFNPPCNGRVEGLLFTGDVAGVELLLFHVGTRKLFAGDPFLLVPGLQLSFSAARNNGVVMIPGIGAVFELRNADTQPRRVCVSMLLTTIEPYGLEPITILDDP